MPVKGEKRKRPTEGERTENEQYEMEYRIRTEIDNAFYEVHDRLAEWIKRDGNKSDKGIRAAFRGLEIYTRGYIEAQKEALVGTGREGEENRTFELMQRKVQQAAAGLGIEPEPELQLTRKLEREKPQAASESEEKPRALIELWKEKGELQDEQIMQREASYKALAREKEKEEELRCKEIKLWKESRELQEKEVMQREASYKALAGGKEK